MDQTRNKAEEIKQTPNDVLAQLNQANGNLPATLEKSAELYAEMRERLSHSGRDFTEVGKKQQRSKLTFKIVVDHLVAKARTSCKSVRSKVVSIEGRFNQ